MRVLREEIGLADGLRAPVGLDEVALPAPRLRRRAVRALSAVVGAGRVRTDHATRVLHAAGKGYVDLVRVRAGRPEGAPDAVVFPASDEQVGALLAACRRESVAVVPFGGGTSVVGGVAPLRGRHHAVVAVDLRGLDGRHRGRPGVPDRPRRGRASAGRSSRRAWPGTG